MRKSWWDILYILGKTPWDTGITPPELVGLVEEKQIPHGRALDIGCGTGTNAIYLAQRGFEAFGVDISWFAIWQARRKARRCGTPVSFYTGDVTKLGLPDEPADINPVDLVVDIGCLHALVAEDRLSYASMLRRMLRDKGLCLLYAWEPGTFRGNPVGLDPEETQNVLGDEFSAQWITEGEEHGLPSHWYLFRKSSSQE